MTEEKGIYKIDITKESFNLALSLIMMNEANEIKLDVVENETLQIIAEAYAKEKEVDSHDYRFFIETVKKFDRKKRTQ